MEIVERVTAVGFTGFPTLFLAAVALNCFGILGEPLWDKWYLNYPVGAFAGGVAALGTVLTLTFALKKDL